MVVLETKNGHIGVYVTKNGHFRDQKWYTIVSCVPKLVCEANEVRRTDRGTLVERKLFDLLCAANYSINGRQKWV